MNREPDSQITPPAALPSAFPTPPANSSEVEQLRVERDRLAQLVKRLEQERDAYQRTVYAQELSQITDEDIQRYAREEEGLPLEAFLPELEQLGKKL